MPKTYIVASPTHSINCTGENCAWLCAAADEHPHLLAADFTPPGGGICVIKTVCEKPQINTDTKAGNYSPAVQNFVKSILEYCRRGFSGVFFDAEGHISEQQRSAICDLAASTQRTGVRVYVPEELHCPGARVVIGTDICGGTLKTRVQQAQHKYGSVCAAVVPVCTDFTLPSYDGSHRILPPGELITLRHRHNAKTYWSRPLQAWYFTYSANGKMHFVLYDDRESVCKKLSLISSLGISEVFVPYEYSSKINNQRG